MLNLISSCENNKEDDQICYQCIYPKQLIPDCDSIVIYEACEIRPHEQSLQIVMKITKFCNGVEVSSKEEIRFMEDFIAVKESEGAICEEN